MASVKKEMKVSNVYTNIKNKIENGKELLA